MYRLKWAEGIFTLVQFQAPLPFLCPNFSLKVRKEALMTIHEKLAEFYGRSVVEIQNLSHDILTAMEVLIVNDDLMGLHHLGYVFWQKGDSAHA
jgi:hypothetical protein